MPVYNEEAAVPATLEAVRAAVLDKVPGSELLVVDDGSTDTTLALLRSAAARDPRIVVLQIPHAGHGGALSAGFDSATGETLLHLDCDLELDLSRFDECWQASHSQDALLGVRIGRNSPLARRLVAWILDLILLLLFGIRVTDAAAPFKIFRRSLWRELRLLTPRDLCIPSLFVAVHAAATGRRVGSIGLQHRERRTGRSWLAGMALLGASLRTFRELLAYRWSLGFRRAPAQ